MTSVDSTLGDVTVNLDGLWLLQALQGIPALPAELRARPYGAARSDDWLPQHPGMDALRDAGLVGGDGQVVAPLARRLATLAAPDVEVAMLISRGPMTWGIPDLADPSTWRAVPEDQLRVVLARRDGRWVSAARSGTDVTIDDVAADPGVGGADWLAVMLLGLLDSAHVAAPSRMTPLNLPLDQVLSVAAARADGSGADPGRDAGLRELGVRGPALAELAELMDDPAAEAVVYARAHVDAAVHTSVCTLDVRSTAAGRVALYRLAAVRGSAQDWMSIAPATVGQVEQGLKAVLSSLDIRSWEHHRRF
ncbi:ESX secretion-associated protein EspG (plasmid) [Mycolicibacterium psychrotolerans]|uniref:ESX secretion-associated protein EspG n=1 Tax=Mycolicibacterium psychrotolerans TaxID=216929 RepID=UPI003D668BC9